MLSTTDGSVSYAVEDSIALVTLDRPAVRNAISVRMLRELVEAFDAANSSSNVRAVVLTGAGDRSFCAGGDLSELIPRLTSGELAILAPDPSKRFFSDIRVPIVAAVNGYCLAGGFEMMLGTDIRVASSNAEFGLPEVRWGLVPAAGSHVRLPQQVPWTAAMESILRGSTLDAQEAARIGLINHVVPVGTALARSWEIARRIAQNAPVAVRTAKEAAVAGWDNGPKFTTEMALHERVLRTADALEGPRAFLERRTPRFHGR